MENVKRILTVVGVVILFSSEFYAIGLTNNSDSLKAKVFREWALEKVQQKDTTAALLLLEESIYTNPRDWMSFYNRATLHYNLGESAKAISDINRAIELKSDFVNALYFRSMIFYFLTDYKQSESDLNEALDIAPESSFLLRKRGAVRYNLQKRLSALKDFNESINLNPFDPISFYNRYVTKDALGDDKGSKQDLLRALSLGFNPNMVEY
ncbi:MAG: tetratricopeptide repeat protein [Bacteroidota bacterium]